MYLSNIATYALYFHSCVTDKKSKVQTGYIEQLLLNAGSESTPTQKYLFFYLQHAIWVTCDHG